MKEFWNERYGQQTYVYGVLPNLFFKEQIAKAKPGNILLPAEGEGRNGVYAATQGWSVDAFDYSASGKEKAVQLASKHNVSINYEVETLENYQIKSGHYDAVGLIFNHMPSSLRQLVHQRVIEALKPGGSVILEAFEKNQLGLPSGGPKSIDMLYSIEELKEDFGSLDIQLLEYADVMLEEGEYHKGPGKTIRLVAIKP